ncbi:MAG: N-formylglutamate amidohydrolase [Flavobacteriales bacterium]
MTTLVLSCEHGGNDVPPDLRHCFAGDEGVLLTHRGMDIGALDLFKHLVPMAAESTSATLSRLCIELNRSEHHPNLFSAFTRELDPARKKELLNFHRAYRSEFTALIKQRIVAKEDVVHIAVHTYTPVLDGVKRTMDIGLLYDPSQANERTFCLAWRKVLRARAPQLVVRMNQPYKGTSDGFPTHLRPVFPKNYAGIELEVNQRFAVDGRMDKALTAIIREALSEVLGNTGTKAR